MLQVNQLLIQLEKDKNNLIFQSKLYYFEGVLPFYIFYIIKYIHIIEFKLMLFSFFFFFTNRVIL